MKKIGIWTSVFFVFLILSACANGMADGAKIITQMTPSGSDGSYVYNPDISIEVSPASNGIRIRWDDPNAYDDYEYWVARTTDYYLNDYTVITGKLGPETTEYIDTHVAPGTTYVYRILNYYETAETTHDANGNVSTKYEDYYEMSRAVSIEY